MLNNYKIISLCVSRLHDTENHKFIKRLNKLLTDSGYRLFIYDITSDLYWNEDDLRAETTVFDLINYSITDVVMIMDEKIKSHTISCKIIADAKKYDLPVIVIDGKYAGCISVNFDYGKGFEKIVRHVVEYHGAKKLHMIAGIKGNPFSEERENIFRSVLAEYNIPVDDSMISYGMFWAKPAIEAAEELVRRSDFPEAVICANDIMAINAATVFIQNGKKIPEDVIVTGFDGLDEINYCMPKISSVRCSGEELADTVFEAAYDCLNGRVEKELYNVVPATLFNESCGCGHLADDKFLSNVNTFNDHFYQYHDDVKVLSDMTDRMLSAENIDKASRCTDNHVIHDMCCIINTKCLDSMVDHFVTDKLSGFDDVMFVFFDTFSEEFSQHEIERNTLIPDLEKHLESGYPLIFNVIDYMNFPLGYICSHFQSYDFTDYCLLPQVASALGRGLGGYMTIQYQRHLIRQIEHIYKYDSLTGLYNRLGFAKEYEKLRQEISGKSVPVTVILSDLDGLKYINDNFGHSAGDIAIRAAASALMEACPENALCVRFGGDEMLAVIAGECDTNNITRQIHDYLERYNSESGKEYQVNTSIGVYTTTSDLNIEFEFLIKNVDSMMYSEKLSKRSHTKEIGIRESLRKLSIDSPDIPLLKALNHQAFPDKERIPVEEMFGFDENIDVLGIYEKGDFAGFFVIMRFRKCAYICYFAVCPERRSMGLGTKALELLRKYYKGFHVVVDFEAVDENAPNNDQRIRRRNFYLRNGFKETGYFQFYMNTEFEIFCTQTKFDRDEFDALISFIHSKSDSFDPHLYRKD